ncbi:MAG: SDR family oxidoreductase [Fervidicoccaceae archaeon]
MERRGNAVIIGVGTGMGRSIALSLASRGWNLALLSRSIDRLNEICREAEELKVKCIAIGTDAMDERSLVSSLREARNALLGIDALVYNAGGFFSLEELDSLELNTLDKAYFLHIRGLFISVKELLKDLRERKGSIVVIAASPSTIVAGNAAYAATKGAQLWLVKRLAKEMLKYGVRVNSVSPGPTSHDPSSPEDLEIKLGSAEPRPSWDVGEAVAFLLSKSSPRFTGSNLIMDGGLSIPAD